MRVGFERGKATAVVERVSCSARCRPEQLLLARLETLRLYIQVSSLQENNLTL